MALVTVQKLYVFALKGVILYKSAITARKLYLESTDSCWFDFHIALHDYVSLKASDFY